MDAAAAGSTGSTLQLAEALGKVRKRRINGGRSGAAGRGAPGARQAFSHVVVIDFEATCWPRGDPAAAPSEVIEFPAVLARVNGGDDDAAVVDEFHQFVLPTENPRLSEFCTGLTGIDQRRVEEEGVPLATALMLFSRWVEAAGRKGGFAVNEVQPGKTVATILTWSDWDINVCLSAECRRKQVRLPPCLRAWGDLRLLYSTFYGRKPQGLAGALSDLGEAFSGREHSGIADARNTARLARRMAADGCQLAVTKALAGSTPLHPSLVNMPLSVQRESSKKAKKARISTAGKPAVAATKKTPEAPSSTAAFSFKRTPPMCLCGRRSRFLTAHNPGPNQGRSFFACGVRSGAADGNNGGCKFFKWDDDASTSNRRLSVRPPNAATTTGETPKSSQAKKKSVFVPAEDYETRAIATPPPPLPLPEPSSSTSVAAAPAPRLHLGVNRRRSCPLVPAAAGGAPASSFKTVTPPQQYFGNVQLRRM